MTDLFDSQASALQAAPLAARMRPQTLEQYLGQQHLLGRGRALRKVLEQNQPHSMLLWGPPGVGKTTLARLLANEIDAQFLSVSAVLSGVKELRSAIEQAKQYRIANNKRSILFVDEVHRFNKAQQDAFLPYVEDGTVIFVGATTENPSFEVNNALLSRCRTYVLKALDDAALKTLVVQALADVERGLGERQLSIADEALECLVKSSGGDARACLNVLEIASDLVDDAAEIGLEELADVIGDGLRMFDKGGDIFYEQISALHKSVRGSDADASLFWMMAMLDGGCDPLYVARRLLRIASEDIGNADPRALQLCLNAWDVQERLGSPEGELALAQAVLYLAAAPKSNAVYNAFKSARADIHQSPGFDVPVHLRNAPSKLMKELGYGREYRYAHNEPGAFAAGEFYFPDGWEERSYYQPVERGLEIKISEKMRSLRELNHKARSNS
ncbi:replication-associated recombination protein A [Agaribacterium haliotis]|uniref:replication-associated recombination protein A n=1 Tax=Agaribacterium haliotis TaxID=2013869 RepID=UPI000BB53180|nr:replication-associated recombination protein A [Agaribacterium haliotis]